MRSQFGLQCSTAGLVLHVERLPGPAPCLALRAVNKDRVPARARGPCLTSLALSLSAEPGSGSAPRWPGHRSSRATGSTPTQDCRRSAAAPQVPLQRLQRGPGAHELLDGYRMAVYTCVPLSSSTDGGNLRCFSSKLPLGAWCRRMRCTCARRAAELVRALGTTWG